MEVEGKRVRLQCLVPLATSSTVRVDVEGALLLGEVIHSARTENGYSVAVKVEQVIPSLTELAALMKGVFGEARETSADRGMTTPRERRGLAP